jgi:Protein of unknown function (DUF2844)
MNEEFSMTTLRALMAAAALAAVATVGTAHAQLGGMQESPALTQGSSLLNGAVRVHTFTDDGGTTVSEYATSAGRVFAYTWHGPTMPNLRTLLGKYDTSFRKGSAAQLDGTHSLHASHVAQSDVVVESGGRMRSYVGRAWLPQALPPGVTPQDLP